MAGTTEPRDASAHAMAERRNALMGALVSTLMQVVQKNDLADFTEADKFACVSALSLCAVKIMATARRPSALAATSIAAMIADFPEVADLLLPEFREPEAILSALRDRTLE